MDIAWGTEKTAGLTERMALRFVKCVKDNKRPRVRDKISLTEIIYAGLGTRRTTNPGWVPHISALATYDDDWNDWKKKEKEALKDRLRVGVKPVTLYRVFSVGLKLQADLNADVYGQTVVPMPDRVQEQQVPASAPAPSVPPPRPFQEPSEFDSGVFTSMDIEDTDDRRYANRRFQEYALRVDSTKPQNQTIIKMLVVTEVQMNKATRDLNSDNIKIRAAAVKLFPDLSKQFSNGAADLSLLEKQLKTEPEQESLDAVILRTHDVRDNWRSTEIENMMGLHKLYDLYEKMHKTNISDDEDESEPLEIPEVSPIPQRTGVQESVALSYIEASEADDEGLVVKSN